MGVGVVRARGRFVVEAAATARTIGIATLAGFVAGLIGGLWLRLAMRVSGLATGGACPALVTENGFRCGDITLAGTAELMVFAGLFVGLLGGLFFAAVAPWLPRGGPAQRGLVFGLALLAAGGWIVFDPENVDFERFGPPAMNVVLFAITFVVFGVALVYAHRFLDDRMPALSPMPRSMAGRAAAVFVLGAGVLTVVAVAGIVVSAAGAGDGAAVLTFAYFFGVLPLARRFGQGSGAGRDAHRAGMPPALSYALLGLPLLAGLAVTLRGIAGILAQA
jgi:hypothetical protein